MARPSFSLRFLRVVTPFPPLMIRAAAALGAAAAIAVAVNADATRQVLESVLLLQVFAAASGFAAQARRGHYDLLLTRGESRFVIALAHWCLSVAPGLGVWALLTVVEGVSRGGFPKTSLASGTLVSLLLVSTLPWATTVALPRYSGAIGWLVASSLAANVWRLEETWRAASVHPAAAAVTVLMRPELLIGQHLSGARLLAATPAAVAALALMGGACLWIARSDYRLEASQ